MPQQIDVKEKETILIDSTEFFKSAKYIFDYKDGEHSCILNSLSMYFTLAIDPIIETEAIINLQERYSWSYHIAKSIFGKIREKYKIIKLEVSFADLPEDFLELCQKTKVHISDGFHLMVASLFNLRFVTHDDKLIKNEKKFYKHVDKPENLLKEIREKLAKS